MIQVKYSYSIHSDYHYQYIEFDYIIRKDEIMTAPIRIDNCCSKDIFCIRFHNSVISVFVDDLLDMRKIEGASLKKNLITHLKVFS